MSNTNESGQARRIFAKFGKLTYRTAAGVDRETTGARQLHAALMRLPSLHHRHIVTLYKWLHPREKGGTGGVIPSSAMPSVRLAARHEGIVLSAEDCMS